MTRLATSFANPISCVTISIVIPLYARSLIPSYFIGRIPSDTLRKLIFYAIDVPELSWELRVLYRRDSALGIFAREMIRLVRETPWRPLL